MQKRHLGTTNTCLVTSAAIRSLGREVMFEKVFEPMMPGDVPPTYASTELLDRSVGFKPQTPLAEGMKRFTDWFVDFYGEK